MVSFTKKKDAAKEGGGEGSKTTPTKGSPKKQRSTKTSGLVPRKRPKKSLLDRYRTERVPKILGNVLAVALVAVAVALLFSPGGGGRLVKRGAPMVEGNTLRGGDYISSCGLLAASGDCDPRYFELSVDGELGLYKGISPAESTGKLWSSGTRAKGKKLEEGGPFSAKYEGGVLYLERDGATVWKYPTNKLPKVMTADGWPIG